MLRILLLLSIIDILFALDINKDIKVNELLSHSQIYIDKDKSLSIQNIENKVFKLNNKKVLGFGYSPDFNVWIKFKLINSSKKTIYKIIEYDSPITSNVKFFEGDKKKLIKEEGLLYVSENRESINPIFKITLQPKESKTFYIKAYSITTALIVKLNVWSMDAFYKKEILYQFMLAMFFGAMVIIIFYNLLIYFSTRNISYLYYVIFFISITIHHAIYKGVMSLYILSPEDIATIVQFSSIIVAIPTLSLAFFTKSVLDLKQYPVLNKILNYYLILFPFLIIIVYWTQLYSYRNSFSILLLIILFIITCYAFLKKNRQAYFIIFGWFLFLTSGIFMYLSSLGIYDIFSTYPYYTELSLIIESLIFSLSLADKIKQLNREKIEIQRNFILYQKEEKKKLSKLVKEKTYSLKKSLEEQELLLKELNHRVKNSIQTIVAFLRLQIDDTDDTKTQKILKNLENRVMSINHLYGLLYTKENISFVNTYEYFSLLIDDIQINHQELNIEVSLNININIKSESVIYCGFILNEVVTNSFQHAFDDRKKGNILIDLDEKDGLYKLNIKDDGVGYNKNIVSNSLGHVIVETLVTSQLGGILKISSNNGVEIDINWRDNE